jgi:hypothetical protein
MLSPSPASFHRKRLRVNLSYSSDPWKAHSQDPVGCVGWAAKGGKVTTLNDSMENGVRKNHNTRFVVPCYISNKELLHAVARELG